MSNIAAFTVHDIQTYPDFSTVREFEAKIAEFFGAPAACAVDSCTHGLELCLRYTNAEAMASPVKTYLSVPMLSSKLSIKLYWSKKGWKEYYPVHQNLKGIVVDSATFWQKNGYKNSEYNGSVPGSFMCLSFQYQKHLSLGRGGMILCPDEKSAADLRKMAYDGREPGIPWREQNIATMGYHYYMTPETAAEGLRKLPAAIATPARIWSSEDYPDISKFDVFK